MRRQRHQKVASDGGWISSSLHHRLASAWRSLSQRLAFSPFRSATEEASAKSMEGSAYEGGHMSSDEGRLCTRPAQTCLTRRS
jgi:hypothetical protein